MNPIDQQMMQQQQQYQMFQQQMPVQQGFMQQSHQQVSAENNHTDSSQLSSSNAPVATSQQEIDRFQVLERKLEQFQETARHIGVIASDFNQRNQDTLNGKIYGLIHGLQDLDRLKNSFSDTKVPLELLSILDEGKNPQLYTKEVLERTVEKNKDVNGKMEIYKKFRAHLLKEIGDEMPEMILKYRNLREDIDFL